MSDPNPTKSTQSGPNMAVKGISPSGPSRRGQLRSPLLAGAAAVPAKEAQQHVPGGQGREVSAIAGLSGESRQTSSVATSLSYHMFDSAPDTRKKFLKLFLFWLIVAAVLAGAFIPRLRTTALETFETLRLSVAGVVRQPRPLKTKQNSKEGSRQQVAPAVGERADDVASSSPAPQSSCTALTKIAPSVRRLTMIDRLKAAECWLISDEPQKAVEMLAPLRSMVIKSSEAELNALKPSGTLAEALQLLVFSHVKAANYREAEALIRGRCRLWAQTNTCVARLLVHADRQYDTAALKGLFETTGRLGRKAQARLWYAGALVAQTEGRAGVADQRATLALAAAPRDAWALRKQIYELQAVDLYRRSEVLRLKNLVAAAQTDLSALTPKSRVKLDLLGELTQTADKLRTVKRLLARPDVVGRARSDLEVIDILGFESLRVGLEAEYLKLLSRTRAPDGAKSRPAPAALRRLSLWEIRATLSLKSFDAALAMIGRHDKSYGESAATQHLRGLAYLLQNPNPSYALLAVTPFQQAIRTQGSWESLYGLGIALIRAGRPAQVPPVIKDLERGVATAGQRFWTDMLKAQWYSATGKLVNAAKLLQDWTAKEPGYMLPRELLVDVLGKMGNKAGAAEHQRVVDELGRRQPSGQALDAFASPLGALAYERRPLN